MNISLKTADIGIIATEDDEKTTMDEEQLVKIIKELELLQSRLQDSKKLKEVALNLCNKVYTK